MNVETIVGSPVNGALLTRYFDSLVDRFFKILPMREDEDESLPVYIRSFQFELLGCGDFFPELCNDKRFLTLLSILQYMVSHPECDVAEVKREVFHAISICNRLKNAYVDRGC